MRFQRLPGLMNGRAGEDPASEELFLGVSAPGRRADAANGDSNSCCAVNAGSVGSGKAEYARCAAPHERYLGRRAAVVLGVGGDKGTVGLRMARLREDGGGGGGEAKEVVRAREEEQEGVGARQVR